MDINKLDLIKSIELDENEVIVKENFNGDLGEMSPDSEEEQYNTLMNTFLNRKDKRKLMKYKGFKSFTDRIYGR